ncbi:hypothetical protein BT69DRAFT_1275269, partial [Atractiella rhizophila]
MRFRTSFVSERSQQQICRFLRIEIAFLGLFKRKTPSRGSIQPPCRNSCKRSPDTCRTRHS